MSMLNTIDFMKWRRVFGVVSAAMVIASIALLFTRGLNLGLDFTGGTLIEVHAEEDISLEQALFFEQKEHPYSMLK